MDMGYLSTRFGPGLTLPVKGEEIIVFADVILRSPAGAGDEESLGF